MGSAFRLCVYAPSARSGPRCGPGLYTRIRDTLPGLLATNDQAQAKFEAFARDRLGTGEIADTAMIARYLTSEDPRPPYRGLHLRAHG